MLQATEIPEHLTGTVERVTFHSEESGFCVLRVKVRGRRELVTVVGSAASVHPGEHIDCRGRWVNHLDHGLQFKAERLKTVPPSTLCQHRCLLSTFHRFEMSGFQRFSAWLTRPCESVTCLLQVPVG